MHSNAEQLNTHRHEHKVINLRLMHVERNAKRICRELEFKLDCLERATLFYVLRNSSKELDDRFMQLFVNGFHIFIFIYFYRRIEV